MNYRRVLLYGLGVWLIPFVVAVAIFSWRESDRPLFESIMPVVVLATTMFFTYRYSKSESSFVKEGLTLGLVFLAISVVIDLLMFSWGPMKMSFVDYVKDIGLTYLMMPITTYGASLFLSRGK